MDQATEAKRRGGTALFVLVLAGYFGAQVGLRLVLGGALETDEAEMMVMTPGFRLGYGPQLPLYNWLQLVLFEQFGRSLLTLSLLKNGLLFLSYLFVFLGLRLWTTTGAAALGALSLLLIPDIAWEAQRATTHSNMLLAISAATIAAFLWAMRRGTWAAWVALGIAVGLGGLAKYNFWLVPLGLFAAGLTVAPIRANLLRARALVVPLLAGVIVAGPYWWMATNPALALSSLGKLQLDEAAAPTAGLPEGVPLLAEGLVALLALPLLAAALVLIFGRRGPAPTPTSPGASLLIRAGLVVALAMLAGIWLADIGHITARWLLPVAILAVPGLFVWLHGRISARSLSRLYVAMGLLAGLVVVGLGYDRSKPGARRDVDFAPLVRQIPEIAPMPDTPIVAEFYTAGNLARARPDWRIAPYLGFAARDFGGETVLFLLRENEPPTLAAALREAGWPEDTTVEVIAEGAIDLPYGHSDGTLPIRYVVAATPPAGG